MLTSDNTVSFFGKTKSKSPLGPLSLLCAVAVPDSLRLQTLRQPIWISPTLLSLQSINGKDQIVHITFAENLQSVLSIDFHPMRTPSILRMVRVAEDDSVLVEFSNGTLHQHSPTHTSSQALPTPFPTPCVQVAHLPFSLPAVGLTSTGKLYIGATLLSTECNSFFVQGEFLLYTTTSHKLHFFTLREGAVVDGSVTKSVSVERGAVLVAAVAFDVRVVLQMPRVCQ